MSKRFDLILNVVDGEDSVTEVLRVLMPVDGAEDSIYVNTGFAPTCISNSLAEGMHAFTTFADQAFHQAEAMFGHQVDKIVDKLIDDEDGAT